LGDIYLIDGGLNGTPSSVNFHASILATSPNLTRFKDFEKHVGGQTLYMPCWSLEELEKVRPSYQTQNSIFTLEFINTRFATFGGIP